MLMILAITIHNIPGRSCPSIPAHGQPLPEAIPGGSRTAAATFSPFFCFLLLADGTPQMGAL